MTKRFCFHPGHYKSNRPMPINAHRYQFKCEGCEWCIELKGKEKESAKT